MAKVAWIFPGQGSQYVGMGKDLADAYPVAREVFDRAGSVLGFDLARVCFEGPEERLRETRFTQTAILAHSVAVLRLLEGRVPAPDYVAGHSVGEYAALVAAGMVAFDDALRLVKVRAEAMYEAGLMTPGAMAALMGMPEGNLEALLADAGRTGVVRAANYNSPVQVVISGEAGAVEAAVKAAPSFGAKRAIPLKVSGAFHSPLMQPAAASLAQALKAAAFSKAGIPIVSNVTAQAVTEPADIIGLLERQLTSPVLWQQSARYMADQGVSSFVEVGPGNVLAGLAKRITPDATCVSLADVRSVEAFFQGARA